MWLCVAQQTGTNIAGNLLPPASVFPEDGGLSNITICNGCQVTLCFHDSSLLGYGTVTGLVFSDILIKIAWPRRQRHCVVFQNIRNYSPNNTSSHPGSCEFSVSLQWQLHNSAELGQHENYFCVVYLMTPIAETMYCWMVGWTVNVKNVISWFILLDGHEKWIVLLMHFMCYMSAVDGLAGMLYVRRVRLAAHLNFSGSV
jgi:hypothetical protein